MAKKKEAIMVGGIFKKVAGKIGAKVLLEPSWKVVGQITFKNGKRSYFRYNTLDLNPMGSSEIAKDKDYANFFMRSMGYKVIPKSKTFFSEDWAKAIGASNRTTAAAYKYATGLGFPLIVKPNSGSQGTAICLVHNKKEFYTAIEKIFKLDRVALVQPYMQGKDYRLVVLDDKVISAYERIPLNVVGDGISTIKQLLHRKQKQFIASNRDTIIVIDDQRIRLKLKHQNKTLGTIPKKDEKIYLLDNANLSTGGDAIDVTNCVHIDFKKLAIDLTKKMNLRLCGVDLIINGNIEKKPKAYWITEINSAPGLDHYAKMGKTQQILVEKLYTNVLKHLAR